jgi:hypothetical protein
MEIEMAATLIQRPADFVTTRVARRGGLQTSSRDVRQFSPLKECGLRDILIACLEAI